MNVALGALVVVIAVQTVAVCFLAKVAYAAISGQIDQNQTLFRALLTKSVPEWDRVERTAQRPEMAGHQADRARASAQEAAIMAGHADDLEVMFGEFRGASTPDLRERMPTGLDGT